jgi:hypothetical protein
MNIKLSLAGFAVLTTIAVTLVIWHGKSQSATPGALKAPAAEKMEAEKITSLPCKRRDGSYPVGIDVSHPVAVLKKGSGTSYHHDIQLELVYARQSPNFLLVRHSEAISQQIDLGASLAIVVCDLNGDGLSDILVDSEGDDAWKRPMVYTQNEQGEFLPVESGWPVRSLLLMASISKNKSFHVDYLPGLHAAQLETRNGETYLRQTEQLEDGGAWTVCSVWQNPQRVVPALLIVQSSENIITMFHRLESKGGVFVTGAQREIKLKSYDDSFERQTCAGWVRKSGGHVQLFWPDTMEMLNGEAVNWSVSSQRKSRVDVPPMSKPITLPSKRPDPDEASLVAALEGLHVDIHTERYPKIGLGYAVSSPA